MGTKNDPAPNDCYAKAEPDEPMFTLLARDPLAPQVVRFWAALRTAERGVSDKTDEALACAEAMQEWRDQQTWCGICGKRLDLTRSDWWVNDAEVGPACADHYPDADNLRPEHRIEAGQ